jgi:hypothetical protein
VLAIRRDQGHTLAMLTNPLGIALLVLMAGTHALAQPSLEAPATPRLGGMKFIWIPTGSFQMGSQASSAEIESRYGGVARVPVLVIEPAALQEDLLAVRIQMPGSDLGGQSPEQSATPDHPLKGQERVLQVQLQTEIGRQRESHRHFLFLSVRGELLGQGLQNLLFEAQLEELLLVGLADDFDLIKLAARESLQHPLGVRFDEIEIKHPSWPPCPARPAGAAGPFDR